MKRFAITTMLAGSIFAGLIGAAATAHAEHDYVDTDSIGPTITALPRVDTTARSRTVIVRHR